MLMKAVEPLDTVDWHWVAAKTSLRRRRDIPPSWPVPSCASRDRRFWKITAYEHVLSYGMPYVIRLVILLSTLTVPTSVNAQELATRRVTLRNGISINYVEQGAADAVPVIFIHGTIGDMRMWTDYLKTFGKDYRAIAYSRRYNYPNKNTPPPGTNHSTAVEAADLAELIQTLKLPKAHVVGYSYGGYTALHLAVDHPELVRTLVLAEPPLIPWLADLSTRQEEGRRFFERQQTHFVNPARQQIARGDIEGAIKTFVDYVVHDGAYNGMPPSVKQVFRDNSLEFRAEVTSKAMFAPLTRREVASIAVPTLMLSGQNTIGALKLTDDELEKTLPAQYRKRVTIKDATHLMWQENPAACTKELLAFFNVAGANTNVCKTDNQSAPTNQVPSAYGSRHRADQHRGECLAPRRLPRRRASQSPRDAAGCNSSPALSTDSCTQLSFRLVEESTIPRHVSDGQKSQGRGGL